MHLFAELRRVCHEERRSFRTLPHKNLTASLSHSSASDKLLPRAVRPAVVGKSIVVSERFCGPPTAFQLLITAGSTPGQRSRAPAYVLHMSTFDFQQVRLVPPHSLWLRGSQ